ncbi:MAG: hypothetical protein RR583_05410, partial [Enterococcus sp.]
SKVFSFFSPFIYYFFLETRIEAKKSTKKKHTSDASKWLLKVKIITKMTEEDRLEGRILHLLS